MALALSTQAYAEICGSSIITLTIDHALRPESAAEAEHVGAWLRARGTEHHILRWEHAPPPPGNLQENAREARYALLTGWCRAHHIRDLLVAHTADDQAETFLHRLTRGSGVNGLACMEAMTQRGEVRILRPFLTLHKHVLVDFLRAENQPWIEDPSNENDRFTRVRLRKISDALAAEGLSTERILNTVTHMRRARHALEFYTAELLQRAVTAPSPLVGEGWEGGNGTAEQKKGDFSLHLPTLLAAPEEVGLRALSHLLQRIGGQEKPVRFTELERLYHHLKTANAKGVTLGNCRLSPSRKKNAEGMWKITAEYRTFPG